MDKNPNDNILLFSRENLPPYKGAKNQGGKANSKPNFILDSSSLCFPVGGQTQFYAYFHNSIVIVLIIRYIAGFITNWNQVDWTLTDMIVTQILQPNCVKVPVENREKEAAITELIDLLDANGLLLDRNMALDAVLTRERIRSTAA